MADEAIRMMAMPAFGSTRKMRGSGPLDAAGIEGEVAICPPDAVMELAVRSAGEWNLTPQAEVAVDEILEDGRVRRRYAATGARTDVRGGIGQNRRR